MAKLNLTNKEVVRIPALSLDDGRTYAGHVISNKDGDGVRIRHTAEASVSGVQSVFGR